MPTDHELHDREVHGLHGLQIARQALAEGRGDFAAVERARSTYIAALGDRDLAMAERLGLTTAVAGDRTNIEPTDCRTGWARAVEQANADLIARHGGTDATTTEAGAPPPAGVATGWAKAVAAANAKIGA